MRRTLLAVLCLLLAGATLSVAAQARDGAPAAQRGKLAKQGPTKKQLALAERRWREHWKRTARRCARSKTFKRRNRALCRSVQGVRGPRGPVGPAGATGATGPAGPAGPSAPARADQQLRLLSVNDFHGNLEPPAGRDGTLVTGPGGATTTVGGAAYLATHLAQLRAGVPNSVFVGNGDLIGASPLVSGLFHDEPTIEAMSALGMEYSSLGNHEFDEGANELVRMQYGGCGPTSSCVVTKPFAGASFRYLGANVRLADRAQTLFPSYAVKRVGGIDVAFIGVTLQGTPDIVTPSGVAGLQFDEEAAAVNRVVKELSDAGGIESYVVMIHQGGAQTPAAGSFADVNGCQDPGGDVFPIVRRMSAKVDVVLTAHTHQPYVCDIDGKLVTQGSSFGRLITDVDLTLDGRTGDVEAKTARNVLVTRDVAPDPAISDLIAKYQAAAAPIANRVVGTLTQDSIARPDTPPANGETPLGDVIADSQLEATSGASAGGSVVAFMNPGGIRASLNTSGPGTNEVTYRDLYTVQPFANTLTVKTLTGAQIKALLEQQFRAGGNTILQVSDGFTYTWSQGAPIGSKVSSIAIGGTPLSPTADYRVTMNSFLATGGDGFTVFNDGTDQLGGDVDIDAFEAYLAAHQPLGPGPGNRITVVP